MKTRTLGILALLTGLAMAIPSCVTPQDLADLGNALNGNLQESVNEVNESAMQREQVIQDALDQYQAGQITEAQLDAAIAQAQVQNVEQMGESLEKFGEQTVASVNEAIEKVKERTSTAAGLIGGAASGDIASILTILLTAGGAAAASRKGVVNQTAKKVNQERDQARIARGEKVGNGSGPATDARMSELLSALEGLTGAVKEGGAQPPNRPTA